MAYNNYYSYLAISILNLVSTFIVQIVVPYVITLNLGAENYAQWIFYFSFLALLNLADFGVIQNTQYSLLSSLQKSKNNFVEFYRQSRDFMFSVTVLSVSLIFLLSIYLSNFILFFISLGILINNLIRFNVVILRSIDQVSYYFLYTIILNLVLVLFVSFAVFNSDHLEYACFAFAIAQLLIYILCRSHVKRDLANIHNQPSVEDMKFTISIPENSSKYWKLTSLQTINQNIVIFLLGFTLIPTHLAALGAMRLLANIGVQATSLVTNVLLPRATYLNANNSHDLIKYKKKFFVLIFSTALIFTIFMSYFGNHIFSIWMGELLLFDQYLLFLLLARMTCVVVGYALQNYEVSVGYPKYTLYMEFFIVVMTLAGFTLSVYLSLEIYNLFILSFIAPYLLFLVISFLFKVG